MAHILERKIADVRHRVRRLLLLDALARLAAVILATALALGTADFLFHFEDRGLRLMSSLALALAIVWTGWRFVRPVLQIRLSDVDLALRLEQRLPMSRDRLASALRFLAQREDGALAGSAAMRRTVIAEATAEMDRLNLDEAVEPRAARRSLSWAAAVVAVVAALAAFDPPAVGTAAARLVAPLGTAQWPKKNHLTFAAPVRRLAAGQTFEVEIKDSQGAPLPDEVFMQFRYSDSPSPSDESSERLHRMNDAMLARKENVTRPFSYRAVGGDDFSMPWVDLEIVEPPRLEQLAVTLHFPDYTGWPARAAEPHLRALVGTRVELRGRLSLPASAVNIRLDDHPPIPARLSEDRRAFAVPAGEGGEFTIERSGAYWIELVDLEGFASGERVRYEIRAVEDFTPVVSVERPRANGFVTPAAKLPVKIIAKDDLALSQAALRFSRSDRSQEDETEIVVYRGPEHAPRAAEPGPDGETGESREIDYELDLAPLQLKPQTQLTIYATAADYYPHLGQSPSHRLTVITADELRERLAERQSNIAGEMSRLLKLERDARSLLSNAEIQIEQVGRLHKQDLDHLQAAELTQRQVERGLTGAGDALAAQITELLADLTQNGLDSPSLRRQLQTPLDEIARLARDELPPIDGDLTAALKAGQVELTADEAAQGSPAPMGVSAVQAPLASAAGHQDEVIETLQRLAGLLAEWDKDRRFHREVAAIRRQQEELNRESAELGRQTLTRQLNKLSGQERADLAKLASRQLDLARQFDRVAQRMEGAGMEGAASETAPGDPISDGNVADALAQAREQAISPAMHESGRQIAANQFGQAAQNQQRAAEAMREMLDILANHREHELGRLVKKLRDAQGQLAELRREQEGLRKKLQSAADEASDAARSRELDRLTRKQRERATDAERLARSLERMQAERAGRKTSQSRAKMAETAQHAGEGQAGAAADAAAEAERELKQAEQELKRRLAQAEADLAQEQTARLQDHLRAFATAEGKLLEDTRHYADVERSQRELTRAQAISVGDLGKQQHALAQEVTALAEKLTGAPVFRLAFDQTVRHMGRAASLLDERNTGEPTQQAEQRSIDLMTEALKALKPAAADEPQPEQPDDKSDQADQPVQQNANAADVAEILAELKLLKWMQDDVNLRTKALDEAHRNAGELSPEARREYQELSEQQGMIAELTLKMAQPGGTQEATEDRDE